MSQLFEVIDALLTKYEKWHLKMALACLLSETCIHAWMENTEKIIFLVVLIQNILNKSQGCSP